MLVDIYNWFTEGFDTAELKDAKALLEELSLGLAGKHIGRGCVVVENRRGNRDQIRVPIRCQRTD
jgi:hypothetical protein